MLFIIPSITIKDGRCIGRIAYPLSAADSLRYEKPEDRARLLRKENAKALHLIFEDEWDSNAFELTRRIKKAVDIPIIISLASLPEDISLVKQILESGIYRLFVPSEASDYFLSHCINDFSRQKIVVSIQLESVNRVLLERLKHDGLLRVCITLASEEETSVRSKLANGLQPVPLSEDLPIEALQRAADIANELDIRLSLLFGVYSYKSLIALANLKPGFDSVILGKALDENSFPCQDIWREMELKAFSERGNEANLWKNPLEYMPHL